MANREIAQTKAQFATLKDLAPTEKAKIGLLMKKLTSTITLQKAVQTDLISKLQDFQHKFKSLQRHNAKLTKSNQTLTTKLANTEEKLSHVSYKLAQKLAHAPTTLEKTVQTQEVKREMRTCGFQTEENRTEPKANRAFQSIREEVTRLSETLQGLTDTTKALAKSGPIISKKADFTYDLVGKSPEREERLRVVLARSDAYSRKSQSSKDLTGSEIPNETEGNGTNIAGKGRTLLRKLNQTTFLGPHFTLYRQDCVPNRY